MYFSPIWIDAIDEDFTVSYVLGYILHAFLIIIWGKL